MDTIFPGWSTPEIINIVEQSFYCVVMFVSVFLVGLRDT